MHIAWINRGCWCRGGLLVLLVVVLLDDRNLHARRVFLCAFGGIVFRLLVVSAVVLRDWWNILSLCLFFRLFFALFLLLLLLDFLNQDLFASTLWAVHCILGLSLEHGNLLTGCSCIFLLDRSTETLRK